MKDVCKRGHALTPDNVSLQLGGNGYAHLRCRQCNSDRARLWRKTNAHRLTRKSGNGSVQPGQTLICR